MPNAESYDVIVIGGGPAGSVMAWSLARLGIRVAVVERARFPREKVCGDFIEPGGLRIMATMQCLESLQSGAPLPITQALTFVQAEPVFQGEIPYYQQQHGLPPHGYVVPRSELDLMLLDRARVASATVYEGCSATEIRRDHGVVEVAVRDGAQTFILSGALVVGADGTESIVARSAGGARRDPRYISISQRGYVEGVAVHQGEAAIWFDKDLYPGYGWMFPMSDGRANVGVGVLAEACARHGLSVPKLFNAFIEKLRRHHPGCARIRLTRKPVGGVVKSYGGIGRNYFDGGLLIGDAGSFVDPVTGEGITPGMESALIASSTVVDALQRGRFDAPFLARFERDYRAYFDPAMRYLDLGATLLRNRDLAEFWMRAAKRGWAGAAADRSFARVAGASFGGLDLRPSAALRELWSKVFAHALGGSSGLVPGWLTGKLGRGNGFVDDLGAWQRGMLASFIRDPRWHMVWMRDVVQKFARVQWTADNPRVRGVT